MNAARFHSRLQSMEEIRQPKRIVAAVRRVAREEVLFNAEQLAWARH